MLPISSTRSLSFLLYVITGVVSPTFFVFGAGKMLRVGGVNFFFSVLPSRVYLQEVQLQREKKQASFEGLASNGIYIGVILLIRFRDVIQLCRIRDPSHRRCCECFQDRRRKVHGTHAHGGVYAHYPRGQLETWYPL